MVKFTHQLSKIFTISDLFSFMKHIRHNIKFTRISRMIDFFCDKKCIIKTKMQNEKQLQSVENTKYSHKKVNFLSFCCLQFWLTLVYIKINYICDQHRHLFINQCSYLFKNSTSYISSFQLYDRNNKIQKQFHTQVHFHFPYQIYSPSVRF